MKLKKKKKYTHVPSKKGFYLNGEDAKAKEKYAASSSSYKDHVDAA